MKLNKKIFLGFISCILILSGVAFFSYKNNQKYIRSNELVNHTNHLINEFGQIHIYTVDAETTSRGFVITGNESLLPIFIRAKQKVYQHLEILLELSSDNPQQHLNVKSLEQEIKLRLMHLDTCIKLRQENFDKAVAFISSGKGIQMQNHIFELIDKGQKIEKRLLFERKRDSINDAKTFNIVFILLILFIVIILLIVYVIVIGNMKKLKSAEADTENKNWLLQGGIELNSKLIGDQSIRELSDNAIHFLCTYLHANVGVVYHLDKETGTLEISGKYAFQSQDDIPEKFSMNEGLIGQVAKDQKPLILTDLKDGQIRVTSSLLNAKPKSVLISPFVFESSTLGVVELGKLTDFSELEQRFIYSSMNSIAISINTAINQEALKELLAKIQIQKDALEITSLEISQQVNSLNQAAIVSITDAKGKIIYANDNFCKISKYTLTELMGQNHKILKSGKQEDTLFSGLWKTIGQGEVWKGEILNKAKDGSFYWVDTTITPFMDVDGKIEKYVSIRFEITESKNQVLELAEQANEKEKRADELAIANKELAFQNTEKEKRADELVIANKELAFQNNEKEKRAEELVSANNDLASQAEELQTQQEELKQMNEELEEQSYNLKQQQEELQMTNEELEEQTQSLEERNKEVENAKTNIEQKTRQLEISSKYKSEFLANMSHELRTPLNSLLILSKDLSDNKKKNLDAIQVESAEIIYKSGHDLLALINEVLDLSKIEAGKMSLNIENIYLREFTSDLIRDFKHFAEQKGLKLSCILDKDLPDFIKSDLQRLNQILKNLLSNALKFTEKGEIVLNIQKYSENSLLISVSDTGIGIQKDKQQAIFEAFQQAEGGTARKYGGTGLGLSISRELAKLLGAEITLSSVVNEGSVFSLIIPLEISSEEEIMPPKKLRDIVLNKTKSHNDATLALYPGIKDDRNSIENNDIVVLIVEDDLKFASVLIKQANKKGFKCLSASSGENALLLASKFKPQAIILDMGLPDIDGATVLHELKSNPNVRHIPVHIISGDERSLQPIREGAVEYLMKPISKADLEEAFNRIENFVNRKIKNLLIIEDNENARKAMKILIGKGDVQCFEAANGQEALDLFREHYIDCIILDLGLPDMSGFELIKKLEALKKTKIPPIIVYTGKELTKEENDELMKYSESIIIKGVKSEERLLDETALFLHRTISNLPKSKQLIITSLYDKESIFHSKKILLVDDDSRNIFALSKVLQERGMEVIKAENGRLALDMLSLHKDVDLVLMDIMMPEMDGYEAMREIRLNHKFKKLPVIALTAKAMKDDKQKCIDAGANDYITKPIDVEQLLSLMRVWLSK